MGKGGLRIMASVFSAIMVSACNAEIRDFIGPKVGVIYHYRIGHDGTLLVKGLEQQGNRLSIEETLSIDGLMSADNQQTLVSKYTLENSAGKLIKNSIHGAAVLMEEPIRSGSSHWEMNSILATTEGRENRKLKCHITDVSSRVVFSIRREVVTTVCKPEEVLNQFEIIARYASGIGMIEHITRFAPKGVADPSDHRIILERIEESG